MTENSSTPRQGNAEDRADYSSFSALSSRVSNIDFNVELISNEANSISHRWYRQHAYIHASQLMRKACRFKILTNWPVKLVQNRMHKNIIMGCASAGFGGRV